VLLATDDGTASIWNAGNGRLLHTLRGRYPVFSPDGKLVLATDKRERVRVWDARTGRPLAPPPSPSGAYLDVTVGDDGTAQIWKAAGGQPFHTLVGHSASVDEADFSRDGKLILTVSGDGTARVWVTASGRNISTIRGNTLAVQSAVLSPDRKLVLTVDNDKTA